MVGSAVQDPNDNSEYALSQYETIDIFQNGSCDPFDPPRTATRRVIHNEGFWHKSCHMYVFRRSVLPSMSTNTDIPPLDFLIQLRSASKLAAPLCWDCSAAGHVEAGCTTAVAAHRELEEEIGLRVPSEQLVFSHSLVIDQDEPKKVPNGSDGEFVTFWNRERADVFIVLLDDPDTPLKPQESEVAEMRWIPLRDFMDGGARGAELLHGGETYIAEETKPSLKIAMAKLEELLETN